MIRSTFGAPWGGTTRAGQYGFDWLAWRLISPPNFGGGGGRYFPSIVVVALGEPGAASFGCVGARVAAWATRAAFGPLSPQHEMSAAFESGKESRSAPELAGAAAVAGQASRSFPDAAA